MKEVQTDAEFMQLLIAHPDDYIVTATTSSRRVFATTYQCPASKDAEDHHVLAFIATSLAQGFLGIRFCSGSIESLLPQCFDCPAFTNKVGPEFRNLGEVMLNIWSRNQVPKGATQIGSRGLNRDIK